MFPVCHLPRFASSVWANWGTQSEDDRSFRCPGVHLVHNIERTAPKPVVMSSSWNLLQPSQSSLTPLGSWVSLLQPSRRTPWSRLFLEMKDLISCGTEDRVEANHQLQTNYWSQIFHTVHCNFVLYEALLLIVRVITDNIPGWESFQIGFLIDFGKHCSFFFPLVSS